MEKILEDIAPTSDELFKQLHNDQASGSIVQVLIGAASQGFGIMRLWKALRHDAPHAWETAQRHGIAVSDQPLVQIFKTVHAGQAAYTGKLSLSRVWRGNLADGATLNGARVGGIYHFSGGEPVRVPTAQAGELVAIGRLEGVATGAILGLHDPSEALDFPTPPRVSPPDRRPPTARTPARCLSSVPGRFRRNISRSPQLNLRRRRGPSAEAASSRSTEAAGAAADSQPWWQSFPRRFPLLTFPTR